MSNFTNPSQTQIQMIDIGHKSLPITIGPYPKFSLGQVQEPCLKSLNFLNSKIIEIVFLLFCKALYLIPL